MMAWFNFSEVPNNWLGYSIDGNKGVALGKTYADFLYKNINFALNTNGITQSQHIEKVMLLYEDSGKDKISDLTVNLIKHYLCEYTQRFAEMYIDESLCRVFPVDKAYFNYDTESFVTFEYKLPFIINEKGRYEYVLLTPYDILREGEPAINRKDFYKSYNRVRASIDNEILRTYVNNYIAQAVQNYENKQRKNHRPINEGSIVRIEKAAFEDVVRDYPELYDYYIKIREKDTDEIRKSCNEELEQKLGMLLDNAKALIELCKANGYNFQPAQDSYIETRNRIMYFNHIIEDCDGYRCLYKNDAAVANEKDLQWLFKFVWYGTKFKVDAEPNNGGGQADFIVSYGQDDQKIVEFKLANNSTLSHVFNQVQVYEEANGTTGSFIVIFFFLEQEERRAYAIVTRAGHEDNIGSSIFFIDCRRDNKVSASRI